MSAKRPEHISWAETQRALTENLSLLDPAKHTAAYNLNVALAHLIQMTAQLSVDVDLLHRKLQALENAGRTSSTADE